MSVGTARSVGSVLSTFPSYRRRILQCRSKYCTSSVVILTSLTNSSNLNTNSTCEPGYSLGDGWRLVSSAENVADPPAYQIEIKCSVCLKKVSSLKLLFCLPFHSHRGVIVSFPMDDNHFQSRKKKRNTVWGIMFGCVYFVFHCF